jgi:ribosomal protein S18 acetylase RimI-like enzyme
VTALLPYHASRAPEIVSWARSPGELEHWVGSVTFPPQPDLVAEWHRDPDVHPYLFVVGDELAGYGEVWHDREESEAELARIIVAPARRGRGLGRVLVELLAAEAKSAGFSAVWLRVVPTNTPAVACYRAAGFVRARSGGRGRLQPGSTHQVRLDETRRVSASRL